jgi:hypothetical protein
MIAADEGKPCKSVIVFGRPLGTEKHETYLVSPDASVARK